MIANKQWPCYFFKSDTTGEKDFEEFFTDNEDLDMERFETVGVIKNQPDFDEAKLDDFMDGIEALREKGTWSKDDIVKLYFGLSLSLLIKRPVNIWIRGCKIWTVFLIFYFLG